MKGGSGALVMRILHPQDGFTLPNPEKQHTDKRTGADLHEHNNNKLQIKETLKKQTKKQNSWQNRSVKPN